MISSPGVRRFTVTESREAVEVTADNLDEVAAWCGGEVQRYKMWNDQEERFDEIVGIEFVEGSDVGWADTSDRIVTDGQRWWSVTAVEFERASEQWTETT